MWRNVMGRIDIVFLVRGVDRGLCGIVWIKWLFGQMAIGFSLRLFGTCLHSDRRPLGLPLLCPNPT